MSTSLNDKLRALLRDPDNALLAESIFGMPPEAGFLAESINGFCRREFGSGAGECLTISLSVGAMFGIVLDSGLHIALKIHRVRQNRESLQAVTAIQQYLHKKGFPCPKVLKPPEYFHGDSIATTEEYAVPGEFRDTHAPALRRAMAEKLAEHIQLIRNFDMHPRLLKDVFPPSRLYPDPHNVLFNFDKTSRGAEHIDERAREAKAVVQSIRGNPVPGHCDWSGKHFRFEGDTVAMIYDWDSLRIEDELEIIGHAAATFTVTWELPVRLTPSPDECRAFVEEYEAASKKKFTREELRKVSAASLYILAYSARCEHSRDPLGAKIRGGGFRDALGGAEGTGGYFMV